MSPMIKAVIGKKSRMYKVSFADNITSAIKNSKMFKGWKYRASKDTISANSISLTSLLILDIKSPLRSLLK